MIEKEVTLLPQPDSPTRPSTSPRPDVKVDAVDGFDHAVFGVEISFQATYFKNFACLGK